MKTKADLVKGWLTKAESDSANARLCLAAGQSLDTVCFHAQQAAEKNLRAYPTAFEIEFPFIHNQEALNAAEKIRSFILARLPPT